MLHGIGLRPMSAQEGDFAHCDGRPETLSLDSANPFQKRAGPQNVVTKTGRLCAFGHVERVAMSEDCVELSFAATAYGLRSFSCGK